MHKKRVNLVEKVSLCFLMMAQWEKNVVKQQFSQFVDQEIKDKCHHNSPVQSSAIQFNLHFF